MTQDSSGTQQEGHGDSAAAVTPDSQYADPRAGDDSPPEPADREDKTYAAGTADQDRAVEGEDTEEISDDSPGAQGTAADTVSDGPDKESGFYG